MPDHSVRAFFLVGGELAFKNSSSFDAPRGDCALASNPEQCITHTAETCTGNRPQEASVGSFAIEEVEGADYGTEHKLREAKAAADASEEATWAALREEEREAGQEWEPAEKLEDWG